MRSLPAGSRRIRRACQCIEDGEHRAKEREDEACCHVVSPERVEFYQRSAAKARCLISSTVPRPEILRTSAPAHRPTRPSARSSRSAGSSAAVHLEAIPHRFLAVVVALDQRLAGRIVLALDFAD